MPGTTEEDPESKRASDPKPYNEDADSKRATKRARYQEDLQTYSKRATEPKRYQQYVFRTEPIANNTDPVWGGGGGGDGNKNLRNQ